MPYLRTFGQEFKKILLSYLKPTPSNLSICKISEKKTKILNLGPKMLDLGIFWARTLKNYCHIWNQHPQSYLFAKFCEKTKMPKFGTKYTWFGYYWARSLKKYCHIWNQHPQFCLLQNFAKKQICLKFGPKMPYVLG